MNVTLRLMATTSLGFVVLLTVAWADPGAGSATSQQAPATGWRLTDFTNMMQSLQGRSYERGQKLFVAAHCTSCHRQDNVGDEYGPDLTKLEERFQPLDILRDILDPSRRVADAKFDNWVFETDDGQMISGLIYRETDQWVQVMEKPRTVAPPRELKKSAVVERRMSLVSVMPQGLLDKLSRDDVADLVAYVAARGDRYAPYVQP